MSSSSMKKSTAPAVVKQFFLIENVRNEEKKNSMAHLQIDVRSKIVKFLYKSNHSKNNIPKIQKSTRNSSFVVRKSVRHRRIRAECKSIIDVDALSKL